MLIGFAAMGTARIANSLTSAGQNTPMPPSADPPPEPLIGGLYAIAFQRPLQGAGGGLPAFAATDRRSGRADLMAVQALPQMPPRLQALALLAQAPTLNGPAESLLAPLTHGPASPPGAAPAWFVISPAPPGPPLWPPGAASQRAWAEAELLDCLLRPAAEALAWLQSRHLTHRAIRQDELVKLRQCRKYRPQWL